VRLPQEYAGVVHAVSVDGWFKENKEKLIVNALNQLLNKGAKTDSAVQVANEFLAIRRLVATKAGFHAFSQLPDCKAKIGAKVVQALMRDDDGVTCAALDMLCALMQPVCKIPRLRPLSHRAGEKVRTQSCLPIFASCMLC